jgi:hypothetical protein
MIGLRGMAKVMLDKARPARPRPAQPAAIGQA